MSDGVMVAVLVLGIPFIIIAMLSAIFRYFIALKSKPSQRAGWITGIAYVAAVILLGFAAPDGYELFVPFAPLPAALVTFWFWRHEFKRAWVDDPELLPEGVELEDDSWVSGLLKLALLIAIGLGIALFRMIRDGILDTL